MFDFDFDFDENRFSSQPADIFLAIINHLFVCH